MPFQKGILIPHRPECHCFRCEKKEHSWNWKGGNKNYNLGRLCEVCRKKIANSSISERCRRHRVFTSETREKLRIAHQVKMKNGTWRNQYGGYKGLEGRKKKEERNDSAYNAFVLAVKKRDKGVCRLQNENCFGYKVVHHILSWRDYPEERYNTNNGITLCQYHHPRKRGDEQRLIPTFQELVGSNYIIFDRNPISG